jgi:tricorn protease
MKRPTLALLLLFASVSSIRPEPGKPELYRTPALSRTHIVFHYAGDLWMVGRDGGDARRLTANPGQESSPHFSPDGQWIAFSGEYDGNLDVYVIPASGDVPRRLTWHPAADIVAGWTPDGRRILFRSNRQSYSRFSNLFTIDVNGVFPEELPLHMAEEGSFSRDAS